MGKSAATLFVLFSSLLSAAPSFSAAIEIPDEHAFKGWNPVNYEIDKLNLDSVPKVRIDCPRDPARLYPVSPHQELKRYHQFDWGSYNHALLFGDSEACAQPSIGGRNGRKFCARPDVLYNVVISDVYRDRCGNHYQLFTRVVFLKKNETMASLVSTGHSLEPVPGSVFANDLRSGHTYPFSTRAANNFHQYLFTANASAQDVQRAEASRDAALRAGYSFNPETLTFSAP